MTENEWKHRYRDEFVRVMTTDCKWLHNGRDSAEAWCDSIIDDACAACYPAYEPEPVAREDVDLCLVECPLN